MCVCVWLVDLIHTSCNFSARLNMCKICSNLLKSRLSLVWRWDLNPKYAYARVFWQCIAQNYVFGEALWGTIAGCTHLFTLAKVELSWAVMRRFCVRKPAVRFTMSILSDATNASGTTYGKEVKCFLETGCANETLYVGLISTIYAACHIWSICHKLKTITSIHSGRVGSYRHKAIDPEATSSIPVVQTLFIFLFIFLVIFVWVPEELRCAFMVDVSA